MVVGRGREIVLHPGHDTSHIVVVVGGCLCHNVHIVIFYQHLVGLVHRAGGFPVTVVQGIEVDIHDGAFLSVLLVVYPSDDGCEIMECHLVYQPMLTMEADGLWIMLVEEVEGMNHRVLVAKESVDTALLLGCYILKAQGGNVLVLLDEPFVHHQFLHTVLARVLKLLSSRHTAHGVAHLERRVYQDAVGAMEHLSEHTTHGGAYNQVGFLPLLHVPQHRYGFFGMHGNVLSHECGIRHQLLQHLYRAALSRGEEAVHIHDFFALHQVRELLDVLIFHCL